MSRYVSFRDFDWVLLIFVLLICALGVMEIRSATMHTKFAGSHLKQIYWVVAGVGMMFLMSLVNYQALLDQIHWFYIAGVSSLMAVLLFGQRYLGAKPVFSKTLRDITKVHHSQPCRLARQKPPDSRCGLSAGNLIAILSHVTKNEGFDGNKRIVRERLRIVAKPQVGDREQLLLIAHKWLERGLVEQRQATNPAGRGLGLTTLRKVTTTDAGS